MEFLLRLAIASAIIVVPMILFVARSRSADAGLIFLLPFIGLLPAAATAAIIFVPIEASFQGRGWESWTTPAVILAGTLIAWIILLSLTAAGGPARMRLAYQRVRKEPLNTLTPIAFWMILGGIWGALWRLTDKAIDWIGFGA